MNLSNTIQGTIQVPFHGESAYEIAVRHGYKGTEEEWLESINGMVKKMHAYVWFADIDGVSLIDDEDRKILGTLADFMTEEFIGTWFYVVTTTQTAGYSAYPSSYTIDGANGYINLRDYVVWTGERLVRVNAYEAKASTVKGSDGKYDWHSGVDGLMSSTDKAYLTDLINSYWNKEKLPLFPNPDPSAGWQCNWCRETGIYSGGIKKDCGGHPPVLNDNHTSWLLMVFNGMATDADGLNHNHRLQIAFDLVNSKIYMRRGWMSSNTFADWSEVGASNVSDTLVVTQSGSYEIGNCKNVLVNMPVVDYTNGDCAELILPETSQNKMLQFALYFNKNGSEQYIQIKDDQGTVLHTHTSSSNGDAYLHVCVYTDVWRISCGEINACES